MLTDFRTPQTYGMDHMIRNYNRIVDGTKDEVDSLVFPQDTYLFSLINISNFGEQSEIHNVPRLYTTFEEAYEDMMNIINMLTMPTQKVVIQEYPEVYDNSFKVKYDVTFISQYLKNNQSFLILNYTFIIEFKNLRTVNPKKPISTMTSTAYIQTKDKTYNSNNTKTHDYCYNSFINPKPLED